LEEPALHLVPQGSEKQDDHPARRELAQNDRRHARRTLHAPPSMPRTSLPAWRSLAGRSRQSEGGRSRRRPVDCCPVDDWRSYDGVAEIYERVHAPRMIEPARDLLAMCEPPSGGRVLDVGCGTGAAVALAQELVGPSGLAVGVDLSLGMLRVGARARPGARLAAASAIDLPFADGTFDVVSASFVLSHVTKYETALFDMLRVLRPGGRLAVSSWADGDRDELQTTWLELVEGVVGQ